MHLIARRTLLAGLAGAVVTDSFAETPRSAFGALSTAEEVTKGLDLSGKTALVTGCNSGVGLETMRVLALRGAHVSERRGHSRRVARPALWSRVPQRLLHSS
jgi:hypothetical protein